MQRVSKMACQKGNNTINHIIYIFANVIFKIAEISNFENIYN